MAAEEEQEPWGFLINLGTNFKLDFRGGEGGHFDLRNQSDTKKSNLRGITTGGKEVIWAKIGHISHYFDKQLR